MNIKNLSDTLYSSSDLLPEDYAKNSNCDEGLRQLSQDFEDQLARRYFSDLDFYPNADFDFEFPIKKIITYYNNDSYVLVILENGLTYFYKNDYAKRGDPAVIFPNDLTSAAFFDQNKIVLGNDKGRVQIFSIEKKTWNEQVDFDEPIQQITCHKFKVKDVDQTLIFVIKKSGLTILTWEKEREKFLNSFNRLTEKLEIQNEALSCLSEQIINNAFYLKTFTKEPILAVLSKYSEGYLLDFHKNPFESSRISSSISFPNEKQPEDFDFFWARYLSCGFFGITKNNCFAIRDLNKFIQAKVEISFDSSIFLTYGIIQDKRDISPNFIISFDKVVYVGENNQICVKNLHKELLTSKNTHWGKAYTSLKGDLVVKVPLTWSVFVVTKNNFIATAMKSFKDDNIISRNVPNTLAISKNNEFIVNGCVSGEFQLIDTKTRYILVTLKSHDSKITSIQISPNNKFVYTTSTDKSIKIWDVKNRSVYTIFENVHTAKINSIKLSPSGKHLFSASDDKNIKIICLSQFKIIQTINNAHDEAVNKVNISPLSGEKLFSIGGNTIKIWNAQNQKLIQEIKNAHKKLINSIELSEDENYFATCSEDMSITLWSYSTYDKIFEFENAHTKSINSILFANNSELIISASSDQFIKAWNIKLKTSSFIIPYAAFDVIKDMVITSDYSEIHHASNYILCANIKNAQLLRTIPKNLEKESSKVEVFNNSQNIALASNQSIYIIDMSSKLTKHVFENAHNDTILSLDISADDQLLASSSKDKSIKVWNLKKNSLHYAFDNAHQSFVNKIRFTNFDTLISVSDDRRIKLWDLKKNVCITTLRNAHEESILALEVFRTKNSLMTGSYDNNIVIWNYGSSIEVDYQFKNAHDKAIVALKLAQNDEEFISGSEDCSVKLWSIKRRQLIHHITGAHSHPVTSIDISPDLKYFVTGSKDENLKIWCMKTRFLINHQSKFCNIHSLAINKDNIIVVSSDEVIKLWDIDAQAPKTTDFNSHKSGVRSGALNIHSNILATGDFDGTLKFWDYTTKDLLQLKQKSHNGTIYRIRTNEKHFVSTGLDKSIKIWDAFTLELVTEFKFAHGSDINDACINKDSTIIASVGDDMNVNIWDVKKKSRIHQFPEAHPKWIGCVLITADSKKVITGASGDYLIKIWDIENKKLDFTFEKQHTSVVSALTLSSDEKLLISGGYDKACIVWDMGTKKMKYKIRNCLEGNIYRITITNDSKCFFVNGDSRHFLVIETETGKILKMVRESQYSCIYEIILSKDEKNLILTGADYSVADWKIEKNSNVKSLSDFQKSSIWDISFSKSDKFFISASDDKSLKFVSTKTGEVIHSMQDVHTNTIWGCPIANNQKYFVSGSSDKSLKMWDLNTRKLIHHFVDAHTDGIYVVKISPDSKMILSAGGDKSIKVWNAETKALIHEFSSAHTSYIKGLEILSDNTTIISVSNGDKDIKFWSLDSKSNIHTIKDAHTSGIRELSLSPGENLIATSDNSKVLSVWEVKTKKLLKEFKDAHGCDLRGMAFTPDDRYVISVCCNPDNSIKFWDLKEFNLFAPPCIYIYIFIYVLFGKI